MHCLPSKLSQLSLHSRETEFCLFYHVTVDVVCSCCSVQPKGTKDSAINMLLNTILNLINMVLKELHKDVFQAIKKQRN